MAQIPLSKAQLEDIVAKYEYTRASYFLPASHYKPKQLQNAIKSYAPGVKPEEVVALLDRTLLGGAKDGFLITTTHLYGDMMKGRPVDLNLVSHIKRNDEILTVRYPDGKEETFDLYVFSKDIYNFLCLVMKASEELQEIAPKKREELLDKGMKAFGKKDYAGAKAAFREAAYFGSEDARRFLEQMEAVGW